MRLKYTFVLFIVILAAGCTGSKNKFTVVGEISNLSRQKVTLEQIGVNDIVMIDSVRTDSAGHFQFTAGTTEPGLYRLSFPGRQFILLSLDKGETKVTGDFKQIYEYNVEGSPASASLRNFIRGSRNYIRDIKTLQEVIREKKEKGEDSIAALALADMRSVNRDFTLYIEHYVDTTAYLPNAMYAALALNPMTEGPFLKTFIQKLESENAKKNTRLASDLASKLSTDLANIEMAAPQPQQPKPADTTTSGKIAPDFTLPTPEGQQVSLSSFRGKYVLIDFWASWCGPCRRENPNVVAAYNKFKDKNFTILGVSLDDDKDDWTAAIAKDGLAWTQVSDLKRWGCMPARLYNVEEIPGNFLIDPTGNIVGQNLRGPELEAKLQELLK